MASVADRHIAMPLEGSRPLHQEPLGRVGMNQQIAAEGRVREPITRTGRKKRGRDDTKAFARYLAPLRKAEWVVYAKPPFGGPEAVLA